MSQKNTEADTGSFPKQIWMWLAVVAILTSIVAPAAYHLGQHNGQAIRERAELLFPDLMNMPDPDRQIIARAAKHCELHKVELDISQIKACLKRGALKIEAKNPEMNALYRIESLINQANQK